MFLTNTLRFKENHSPKATRTLVQRSGFSCKKDEKESRKKMALIKFYTRPTNLIKKAHSDFYENLIQENSSDQGKLFKILKQLKVAIFPQHAKRLWFDRFLRRMVLTPFLRIIDL